MLHVGAQPAEYDELRAPDTPMPTATHVPIPHFRVVDMLRHTLAFYGHEVTEEHFGVTEDGMRFFGLLSLRSTYGGYEDTVALRNSHDKKFPVGIGFGGRVFCCDNLSFIADERVKQLRTSNGAVAVEQWTMNKAVHYNSWANFSTNDFKPVVAAFKDLLAQFQCRDCGSFLYVIRTGPNLETLRCNCPNTHVNLKARTRIDV
jgi:hypothetical protein